MQSAMTLDKRQTAVSAVCLFMLRYVCVRTVWSAGYGAAQFHLYHSTLDDLR